MINSIVIFSNKLCNKKQTGNNNFKKYVRISKWYYICNIINLLKIKINILQKSETIYVVVLKIQAH